MTIPAPETLPYRSVDMLLRFSCPMCSTVLEIPRARTGLEGPCPICGATIIAPSVVIAPQTPEQPALTQISSPVDSPKEVPVAEEPVGPLDHHTARLCDLPPRPAFSAREAGTIPEPESPKMERKRRRRRSVVSQKEQTVGEWLKREYWLVVLALVVLAVGAAFALYGDQMFSGFQSAPPLRR